MHGGTEDLAVNFAEYSRLYPHFRGPNTNTMNSTRASLKFILLSIVWGSGFVVVKIGQQYFPPVLFAALAFDVTTLGLLAYVLLSDGNWRPRTTNSWGAVAAIGVFTVTIYNSFFFIGQQTAPSAVGAVILSFIPVITAGLVHVIIPSSRLTVTEVIGLVVGLVGVFLIVRPTPDSVAAGDVSRLLILIAAISNALGSVLVQRIDPPVSTPVLLAWAVPMGAASLHFVSLFVVRESYNAVAINLPGLLAVLYLAFVVNVTGYLIFFGLLREVGAFQVSLVNYLQPIAAAIIGWIVLGESLATATVVGFAVIIVGFSLVKREQLFAYVSQSRTGS